MNLVERGEPKGSIVTSPDASPSARFAAGELQTYVRKATGAELPIVQALAGEGEPQIVVGDGAAARELGVSAQDLSRDAFRIKTVSNRVVILGKDDPEWDPQAEISEMKRWVWHHREHATVFGVYAFLERFLGVRWYLPVDIGEVVPQSETLALPAADILEKPKKLARFIHTYDGADEVGEDPGEMTDPAKLQQFTRRRNLHFMRLRHETAPYVGNHTMGHLINPERFGKSHPEFFALTEDGQRLINYEQPARSQHCFSNGEMAEVVIQDALAYFRGEDLEKRGILVSHALARETPWGRAFCVMQDDGFKPCRCETCEAVRDNSIDGAGKDAELLWSFYIKVARAVKKEFPHAWISTSAYGPTEWVPNGEIPDNMLVTLATRGPYAEWVLPDIEQKKIESWLQKVASDRLTFYHYALRGGGRPGRYASGPGVCGSIPRAYAAYYRRYADAGQGTYMYITSHSMPYDHLSIYMFYKVHWDPGQDADRLLDEYYTLFYGPAAEPMGKYWEEVEERFRDVLVQQWSPSPGPRCAVKSEDEIWTQIYPQEVIDRWRGYFAEAEKLVQDADPIYAQRLAYMKRNVLDRQVKGLADHQRKQKGAS